jgi:hypothetical protein
MREDSSTSTNLALTYVYDKYSCVREFYFIHIFFNYLIAFSGLFCFVTRLYPKLTFLHAYLGKLYILFMLCSTASSLLIHNTGLPLGVLISFLWVIGGLSLGQFLIWRHQYLIHKAATENVMEEILKMGIENGSLFSDFNLANRINQEKGFISAQKSFQQRMISYKAFHGCVMFMSWINIVGRMFASDQSGDFVCYTTPVYKNIENFHFPSFSNESMISVPTYDPKYERLPWANKEETWGVMLSLGPLFGAFLVGSLVAYFNLQKRSP